MIASQHGHEECVRWLALAGAKTEDTDQTLGTTALMFACIGGHHKAVRALLAAKANADVRFDSEGNGVTPLMFAVQYCGVIRLGKKEPWARFGATVQELLRGGASGERRTEACFGEGVRGVRCVLLFVFAVGVGCESFVLRQSTLVPSSLSPTKNGCVCGRQQYRISDKLGVLVTPLLSFNPFKTIETNKRTATAMYGSDSFYLFDFFVFCILVLWCGVRTHL